MIRCTRRTLAPPADPPTCIAPATVRTPRSCPAPSRSSQISSRSTSACASPPCSPYSALPRRIRREGSERLEAGNVKASVSVPRLRPLKALPPHTSICMHVCAQSSYHAAVLPACTRRDATIEQEIWVLLRVPLPGPRVACGRARRERMRGTRRRDGSPALSLESPARGRALSSRYHTAPVNEDVRTDGGTVLHVVPPPAASSNLSSRNISAPQPVGWTGVQQCWVIGPDLIEQISTFTSRFQQWRCHNS